MKTALLSFSLIGALLTVSLAAQDPAPAQAEREARAKVATEQRLAYTNSADYKPYDTTNRDFQKRAAALLEKSDFAGAIAECQKGLAATKYDINVLIILAAAYRESGDLPNAEKTRQQWMSLVDSILNSGDGRDFATAFKVIAVEEEYAVTRILGLRVIDQSLIAHDGSQFDQLHVKEPKSGKELVLYFNIDLPLNWLNRQFSKKSP